MKTQHNRRRWIREVLNPPEIGILYTGNKGFVPGIHATKQPEVLFVDLLNRGLGGVIIRTKWQIGPEAEFHLRIHSALEETWEFVRVKARWVNTDPHKPGYNVIGVEFKPEDRAGPVTGDAPAINKIVPLSSEYEFFKNTDIFKAVHRDAVCALLNSLTYKHAQAGRRLMKQNSKIDTCFIIQSGTCIVNLEEDGKLLPIGRAGEGDIIGQAAILDDWPLDAHIDAQTDLELWGLTRSSFDAICADHPEMKGFLTNLLMDRFSTNRHSEKRKIGKYLITDLMEEGSNSVAYKGVHRTLKLPVTIKMIKHELSLEREFEKNFQKEAQTVVRFMHENVIQIYSMEDRFRTVFLIMERLEGESLKSLMQRWKKLPLQRAVDFLAQTCSGLDYAHRQGIVHRAINPANLFISPGDRLKIIDFGLAHAGENKSPGMFETSSYLASEQIAGEITDQRTDIYALGIIAYEMITGARPFPEDEQPSSETNTLHREFPDPAKTVPGLPELLKRFIQKACDRKPENRFQSARQALKHLQPIVDDYGLQRQNRSGETEKIASLSLRYQEKDQLAVNELMEEFSMKVRKINAEVKAVDIKDA